MSPDSDAAQFVRRHELSPEAIAYKSQRKPSVPIQTPDLTDHAAVARWRAETNALWGEDDDPAVPHRREVIGGIACLVAASPTTIEPSSPPGLPGAAGPPSTAQPKTASEVPTVIYAHGGGYVLGSAAVAIPITARLAAGGLRLVSVDYRQPPEHVFPAALDDVLAVYLALADGDTPVALAGDSAGGALALSAAVTATVQGLRPAAIALFSPLLDHLQPRRADNADADAVHPDAAGSEVAHPDDAGSDAGDSQAQQLLAAYVGGADPADPRLSPLHAELSGLPTVLIQAGAGEPLAAQAVALHRRTTAAGVDVTLDLWEHMWHTWHYHDLPEADQALAEAADFLAAPLSSSGGT